METITAERFSSLISGFYLLKDLTSGAPMYGVDSVGFSANSLDKELLAMFSGPALVALGFHW